MIQQKYVLNMVPGGSPVRVHVSQYDEDSRELVFWLYSGSGSGPAFTVPDGAVVTCDGTKPDGKGFSVLADHNGDTVTVTVTKQMTAVGGETRCQLTVNKDGAVLGSANFVLIAERGALDADADMSASEYSVFEDLRNQTATNAQIAQAAADEINAINDPDRSHKLVCSGVFETGMTNCQGMACDGEYIYLTHRPSIDDTTTMLISKYRISTDGGLTLEKVGSGSLTEGHYNSLYYYEGKLYACGAGVKTGTSEPDYSMAAVIDAETLNLISRKPVPKNWGIGIHRFNAITGPVTALLPERARNIDLYAGWLDSGNPGHQVPLARINLDYTSSTTVQGTFHMTTEYLWLLQTAWVEKQRAFASQCVRCFSYSGMTVQEFYLTGPDGFETAELEDIWVSKDNGTMIINDMDGRVWLFSVPQMYHTINSRLDADGVLPPGTVKHVYANPGPLDTAYTFGAYSVYSVFQLNDFAYVSEIAGFLPIYICINGRRYDMATNRDGSMLYCTGIYEYSTGGRLSFNLRFDRDLNETGHNYRYHLANAWFVKTNADGTYSSVSADSTDGNLSNTGSGMGKIFAELYASKWLSSNIYIYDISYICGNPYDYRSLDLIG